MTSFESIYDLFMVTSATDYRLNSLYKNDKEAFYDFLRGFLTKSAYLLSEDLINSLEYTSQEETEDEKTVTRYYFISDLLPLEIAILVEALTISWYEKNTEDILEISSRLGTKDGKENNNRSNLKEKNIRIRELYSAMSADIRKLQIGNLDKLEGWG